MTINHDENHCKRQINENLNNIRNFGDLKIFGKNDLFKHSYFLGKSGICLMLTIQIINLYLNLKIST